MRPATEDVWTVLPEDVPDWKLPAAVGVAMVAVGIALGVLAGRAFADWMNQWW